MPVQGEIWFVEFCEALVAGSWGKEEEEEQLCAAAFNCSANRARDIAGSWLPEFWSLCQKHPFPPW